MSKLPELKNSLLEYFECNKEIREIAHYEFNASFLIDLYAVGAGNNAISIRCHDDEFTVSYLSKCSGNLNSRGYYAANQEAHYKILGIVGIIIDTLIK